MLKPFFSIIQVRRNVTISDPPSGCWTFSRSVLWQIPWHYSGVKLLKLSLDTERKGEKEKTKEKPKWKRSRNQSGKKDSLKHWVQLTGCFCSLLSGYSFQHPGVVAFPRMKITTEELEHDGHVRPESSLWNRSKTPVALTRAPDLMRFGHAFSMEWTSFLIQFCVWHTSPVIIAPRSFIAPAKKTSVCQEYPVRMK